MYNDKLENRFFMHFFTQILFYCMISIVYVQKLSGTGMATVYALATISAGLSVAKLQMPDEQLSW